MIKTKEQLDLLKDVNHCEYCQALVTVCQTSAIFYTLSPDPLWGRTTYYTDMTPKRQYTNLIKMFNSSLALVMKEMRIEKYSIHFEFNKQGNLHCHGFIIVNDFNRYDKNRYTIQKLFHSICGRRGLNSTIAFKTDWLDDPDYYTRYVNKENAYISIHKDPNDRSRVIPDWLIKEDYDEDVL